MDLKIGDTHSCRMKAWWRGQSCTRTSWKNLITWFDIDLPDILAVRRKIYQDRDRCVMKEGSALESGWTKDLPKRSTTIVIMEGVLEYFTNSHSSCRS